MPRLRDSRHRGLSTWLMALTAVLTMAAAHVAPAYAASASVHLPPNHAAPSRWFWVEGEHGWVRLRCTELAAGARAELYAPQSVRIAWPLSLSLVSTFDSHIFPTDTRIFGLPSHFGRVAIVLAPLSHLTLGYFDENDLLPRTDPNFDPTRANGGNIVYVGAAGAVRTTAQIESIQEAISHELQHLIDYRIRVLDHRFQPEDLWLNEGLSFYAQVANGYLSAADRTKVDAAAQSPSWPVTELQSNMAFLRRHARVAYGRAGLFVSYLAARFGDAFIRGLVSSRYTGMRAVDVALRALSPRDSLPQVFADWGVAAYLGRRGPYGYGTLPPALHEAPRLLAPPVAQYPFDSGSGPKGLSLQPWGHGYLQFVGGHAADLRLDVTGPAGRISVATVLEDTDGTIPTRVAWLKLGADGHASYRVSELGGFYNRVTLVATDVGSLDPTVPVKTDPFRVRAVLVHVRNDN